MANKRLGPTARCRAVAALRRGNGRRARLNVGCKGNRHRCGSPIAPRPQPAIGNRRHANPEPNDQGNEPSRQQRSPVPFGNHRARQQGIGSLPSRRRRGNPGHRREPPPTPRRRQPTPSKPACCTSRAPPAHSYRRLLQTSSQQGRHLRTRELGRSRPVHVSPATPARSAPRRGPPNVGANKRIRSYEARR
jgi:hypothetical protein